MKKKYLALFVAIAATALFIIPGMALGKKGSGGNGTPSPPPSNPPCDSDNHLVKLPGGLGINKKCAGGSSTGNGTNGGSTGHPTNPPCDSDNHLIRLPKGLAKKCPSTSTGNPSSTGPPPTTSGTGEDACETQGLFGSGSLDAGGPDETLADLLVDNGVPLNEPEVGPGGGPVSEPVYEFVAPLAPPLTPGVAAEVTCILNLLTL